MFESLEDEVQELAYQRHDEILALLVGKLNSKPEELDAALSRYVNLKLHLHRLKRRINNVWWGEKNDDMLSKEYNVVYSKVKEARREYYGIKNR